MFYFVSFLLMLVLAVLLLLLMEGLGGRGWGEDIFNILYFSLPLYLKLVILHCDPL